jgi:lambda family phage portal protein
MISLNLNEAMRERDAEQRREADQRTTKRKQPADHTGSVRRRWDAARFSDLTADWPTSLTTANQDLRSDLKPLRARSRHLAQNNGTMKKFLSMVQSNVIGAQGITLRIAFDEHGNSTPERDAELAKYIQGKFEEYSKPENCTASGKLSLTGAAAFAVRTMARDGEFLCRELKRFGGNEFGYALNFRDVSWLDENFNTVNQAGHRVMMSVEYDDYDRPVRYWLTRPASDYLYGEYKSQQAYRTPVPAADIIHKYLVTEDELQARGAPWGAAAMEPIHVKGGVISAELYATRANACNTDYIIPPTDEDEDGEPTSTNPVHPDFPIGETRDLQSAVQQYLPPGYKVQSNDPKHPNAHLGDFLTSLDRYIASALDVSFESLANNRSAVNYSSIRAGLLEERDIWRFLQLFMIEHFYHRVFRNWLQEAMLTGAVQLSIRDYERLRDNWRPRGWDWVDPLKDIQAAILAIMNGIDSRTDYCDERGKDFLTNVKNLEMEDKAMIAAGLSTAQSALAPVKPKADKSDPGEKPLSPTDDANTQDEHDAVRLLPMFASQLLPRILEHSSQPIIIVLNSRSGDLDVQTALIDRNTVPPKKPNGDSHLLGD